MAKLVMVYEDPKTRLKPEGRARLLRHLSRSDGGMDDCERWQVKFENDLGIYERWVDKAQLVGE